ncbi:flagellin [Brevundimonas sp.]|uniref:flagellin n=1 Tax=Brevundimonas sp. TaxID=1871086 RepID=UPI00289783E3|nr:flagellin [Brevundimonas sp.]
MSLNSLNTNRAALQALQSAASATRDMKDAQSRVSTGYKIASHRDNAAVFNIATQMRSDVGGWEAVRNGLNRMSSVVDVASMGAERISDLLIELKQHAVSLQDGLSGTSRQAVIDHIQALIREVDMVARTSTFDGINLLTGQPVITTTSRKSYRLPESRLPQPYFPAMAALPPGSFAGTSHTVIAPVVTGSLTPASFAQAVQSLNGNNSQTITVDAGATPGRVSLMLDAFGAPDVFEIWQNGVRVAASGQDYRPDGAPVGPGAAVTHLNMLTFDYDPAKGRDLEFRFNENLTVTGTAWTVNGLIMQAPDEPFPAYQPRYQPTGSLTTTAVFDPPPDFADPEQAARARDELPEGVTANHTVNAGPIAGRIDLAFDAFDTPDTLEIWQNGVRVAATGQAYASGGAQVGAATAVAGAQILSFDYNPAHGALEFRFNANGNHSDSAWAVGAIALADPASPRPSSVTSQTSSSQEEGFGPIIVDTFISPARDTLRVTSRDMTASGLGLDDLDFDNPLVVLDRISRALNTSINAASYFGTRSKAIDQVTRFSGQSSDVLESGIGHLVDADLAKAAAELTARQIRQQLATQSLSIANQNPQWLLGLFRS